MKDIEYRWLRPEEFELLRPIFAKYEIDSVPNPNMAMVAGAFKEGRLVGWHVLQLQFHAEPIYIEPESGAEWRELWGLIDNKLAEYKAPCYIFSETPQVDHMCSSEGLDTLPYKVFRKVY